MKIFIVRTDALREPNKCPNVSEETLVLEGETVVVNFLLAIHKKVESIPEGWLSAYGAKTYIASPR